MTQIYPLEWVHENSEALYAWYRVFFKVSQAFLCKMAEILNNCKEKMAYHFCKDFIPPVTFFFFASNKITR